MKKYFEAFGKRYLIRGTAKTKSAANAFCSKYPECGVATVENINGVESIIIANIEPEKEEKEITSIEAFKVGKTYYTRSICDHECIFKYTIISRTAKTVIISGSNNVRNEKKRISVYNGVEQFKPLGNYSMAPIISADKY